METLNVTVGGKTWAEIAKNAKALADALEAFGSTPAVTTTTKAKVSAPKLDQGDEDVSFEEPETDEESEEELPKAAVTKQTVIEAFQNFVKTNSKKDALKVLKSFKAENVHDLKVTQYEKVISTLEALAN